MLLRRVVNLSDEPNPLSLEDVAKPIPASDEILIRVSACGVCHTELDEIEGRTAPPMLPIIPGHEVVGFVEKTGGKVTKHSVGDRVGVGWIHRSSGESDENISAEFIATGRDVNGGYAEYMTVGERYAYRIPDQFSDAEAAPLLCAGGVGYRALRLTGIENGGTLGLTGFGGSGHIVLQLSKYLYPQSPVYVFARSKEERQFALDLGADWAGDTDDLPPVSPTAIIDTTPAWRPVLAALRVLKPGGRLVINAIRKKDNDKSLMADISYADHLWQEKEVKTVANVTGGDIRAMLQAAAGADIRPEVQAYKLEDANKALFELAHQHVRGAKVLVPG